MSSFEKSQTKTKTKKKRRRRRTTAKKTMTTTKMTTKATRSEHAPPLHASLGAWATKQQESLPPPVAAHGFASNWVGAYRIVPDRNETGCTSEARRIHVCPAALGVCSVCSSWRFWIAPRYPRSVAQTFSLPFWLRVT